MFLPCNGPKKVLRINPNERLFIYFLSGFDGMSCFLIFSIVATAVQILITQTNTEIQVDYRTIAQLVNF